MKKIAVLLLCVIFSLALTSCSSGRSNIDSMLGAPKETGDLYEIRTTLEEKAGADINMCYPSGGKYRTPYIQFDVTGNKNNEVIAFYSTPTDENGTVIHANFIVKNKKVWESRSDIEVTAGGIREVSFKDIDNDGKSEVFILWDNPETTNGILTVYSVDNSNSLVQIMKENCTAFAYCFINGKQSGEIITVNHEITYDGGITTYSSVAHQFELDAGLREIRNVKLDGDIQTYSEPSVAKLANNQTAIFIDALKNSGSMITEVLSFDKDGKITAPFNEVQTGENTATIRPSAIASRDFDGDGNIEIPILTALPAPSSKASDKSYITDWQQYNGESLISVTKAIMNYVDGYYIVVPDISWETDICIGKDLDNNCRTIYKYEPDSPRHIGDEVFSVTVLSTSDYKQKSGDVVLEKGKKIYVAEVVNPKSIGMSEDELIKVLQNGFHLITE